MVSTGLLSLDKEPFKISLNVTCNFAVTLERKQEQNTVIGCRLNPPLNADIDRVTSFQTWRENMHKKQGRRAVFVVRLCLSGEFQHQSVCTDDASVWTFIVVTSSFKVDSKIHWEYWVFVLTSLRSNISKSCSAPRGNCCYSTYGIIMRGGGSIGNAAAAFPKLDLYVIN